MTQRALVVGSAVLDTTAGQHPTGGTSGTIGGAGLNVAVGLTRLGVPAALIAAIGDDAAGHFIQRSLVAADVQFFRVPIPHTTVAQAQLTVAGVQYNFRSSIPSGRFPLDAEALSRIADAEVLVLSAYRPTDGACLRRLRSALDSRDGVAIYDPNPRSRGRADVVQHRREIEALAGAVDLVKLSDEDIDLIDGNQTAGSASLACSIVAAGSSVLITHGERGAHLYTTHGEVEVPARPSAARDTRAAGDATVATIASWAAETGLPHTLNQQRAMLTMAMRAASITCERHGGAPSLPTRSELAHE